MYYVGKDPFSQRILEIGSYKLDPCSYLFKYSLDVLKKKAKDLDIFIRTKNIL